MMTVICEKPNDLLYSVIYALKTNKLNKVNIEFLCNFEDGDDIFNQKENESFKKPSLKNDFKTYFKGDLSKIKINANKILSFERMFANCDKMIKAPTFIKQNEYSGGSMFEMFENCTMLKQKSNLDLSNAINITDMYKNCPLIK